MLWSAIFKYIAAVLYNMLFSKYPAIFQLLFSLLIVIFYIACDYENNREIECYFQLLFSLLIVLFYIVCYYILLFLLFSSMTSSWNDCCFAILLFSSLTST